MAAGVDDDSVEGGAAGSPGRRATWLFGHVDIASLAAFRAAFGALMVVEIGRLAPDVVAAYVEPRFHFTYHGFAWVRPWSGPGMAVEFAALAVAAACVGLGLCYRAAALVLFVGLAHVFLLEQALYLNHMYLIVLLALLMVVVPAHRAWSIDALRRPALGSSGAPRWALWLVRAQIGIPYFYAGIAKLNADWIGGEPVRSWLRDAAERGEVAPWLAQEWVVRLVTRGGLVFDLLVVPALLWPRTRAAALVLAIGFHLANSQLFEIGIFPWLMIAATTIFLPPDWPRRLRDRAAARVGLPPAPRPILAPPPARLGRRREAIVVGLALYVGWQSLFPLRHWLYPGDVAWTEEGHKFSWRMKLRDKDGSVEFHARDPATGAIRRVELRRYLKGWQRRAMAGKPEMIHAFAGFLGEELRGPDGRRPEIHVHAWASLNGRRAQPLIDPGVDLAAEGPSLGPARWIRRGFADE